MYNYNNYDQKKYHLPDVSEGYPLPKTVSTGHQNVFTAREGFIRGNMFKDLYDPYISVEPFNLMPSSEREDLLNHVRDYGFAATDLGLYLDVHPDDTEKIKIFNECLQEGQRYKNEFEQKYGPLSLDSETLNNYPWAWITPPWPWEVK